MIKKAKRQAENKLKGESSVKKIKVATKNHDEDSIKAMKGEILQKSKKAGKGKGDHKKHKGKGDVVKAKTFAGKKGPNSKSKQKQQQPADVADWNEFKKKKKELKVARKQNRNQDIYEATVQAKKIGEKLRCKTLKGGNNERVTLCEQLHEIITSCKEKGVYGKFVLAHDMARVVQVMLKYASDSIKQQISKELIPSAALMMQSKYGKFCVKRMMKYGSSVTRSSVVAALYGHVVKLSSHTLSSAEVDYAYTTWASPVQKQHLQQEFYSDLYKTSKDNEVKCLADAYKDSPHMKAGILAAMKSNLEKVINKELLNNGLIHAVLNDYLSECSVEDCNEFISSLCSHITILSNTKEGSRVAMRCIWNATNKDRKVILRNIKEHVLPLAQHEHGHNVLIAILSSIDDTVLLNKMLLGQISDNAESLVQNEWGRKVLLWLFAPNQTSHFHPSLIKELANGCEKGASKKPQELRSSEILGYCFPGICKAIEEKPNVWLQSGSIAMVTLSVLKAGDGEGLKSVFKSIAEAITKPDWKVASESGKVTKTLPVKKQVNEDKAEEVDQEVLGIEHPGLHMALKKLAQYDKIRFEKSEPTFGQTVVESLDIETAKKWLKLNRACFLLVVIFENGTPEVKEQVAELLKKPSLNKTLKKQDHQGAKILLNKLE